MQPKATQGPVSDKGPGASKTVQLGPENYQDPWQYIAESYGLGKPPAEGMPTVLPGVQVGAPPSLSTDPAEFLKFMNQINGQIGGAYNYDTPQGKASLMDTNGLPHPEAQQFGESDQLKQMLNGQGYSPETLARMRATAVQGPAQAGLQQMSQMKRMLGEQGIHGGAEVALRGDVARQTGQAQSNALNDVEVGNAKQANQNMQFGIGQQTSIGMGNMQAANQMAMQNANIMYQALAANQSASNSMTQMNTGLKAQQDLSGANAQAGFLGQQGAQGQQMMNNNAMENANKQWDQQKTNTSFNWDKQTRQFDELNKRFGQSQNILGGWASPGA